LIFKRSALKFELKALPEMLIYGIVGYAGVQAFYFIAIVRMPVSVGLIIEFTAAIWITLWVRFVRKQYVPRTMVGRSLFSDSWY
jgi:threonine/homoserine efflux transporter RhtA